MIEEGRRQELQRSGQSVDGELYEELLNRYERILVFAGQQQERLKQQRLLVEKTEGLEQENKRLRRLLAVEQSYLRLLENSLEKLGVIQEEGEADSAQTQG